MNWITRREELPASPEGNVVQLRPYQHRAARQRRLAWWSALVFGVGPEKKSHAKQMTLANSGELLSFRQQAAGRRW